MFRLTKLSVMGTLLLPSVCEWLTLCPIHLLRLEFILVGFYVLKIRLNFLQKMLE